MSALGNLQNKNRFGKSTELELCILMAGTLCDPETAAKQLCALQDTNARLINAAEGRGMVSEMDNMQEVAVLVCGLHDKIEKLENFIRTRNVVCTWCGFKVVYDNENEEEKQAARDTVNAHALICEKDPRNIDIKAIEANYDALQYPMPCGHLARYAVNEEDGTQYCAVCASDEFCICINNLEEAITEYLNWGPMTQSDRYLHEQKFKRLLGRKEDE